MGKYGPLGVFLTAQDRERIQMTFAEIENVIGAKLPNSKQFRAWWSNNPWNNVMTREWLNAGYETESVDIDAERLVFRRVRTVAQPANEASGGFGESPQKEIEPSPTRHPMFGCMKGLGSLEPGYDLTQPILPDWAEYEEKKYGPGSKLYDE